MSFFLRCIHSVNISHINLINIPQAITTIKPNQWTYTIASHQFSVSNIILLSSIIFDYRVQVGGVYSNDIRKMELIPLSSTPHPRPVPHKIRGILISSTSSRSWENTEELVKEIETSENKSNERQEFKNLKYWL